MFWKIFPRVFRFCIYSSVLGLGIYIVFRDGSPGIFLIVSASMGFIARVRFLREIESRD